MGHRTNLGAGLRILAVAAVAAGGLAACDRPGPLSAAARGDLPPPPQPPAWAAPLAGRPLKAAFPATVPCVGNVDALVDRYRGARKARGWAWNPGRAQPVRHLAVADAAGRMVGFGEGGDPRPDVAAIRSDVTSRTTGWWVISPAAEGSTVYGLDEATRSACVIGPLV